MPAIVDTGPLVAFFDRSEQHHAWAVECIEQLEAPLLICEPILAEAMFLLAQSPRATEVLFQLLQNGAIHIGLHIEDHLNTLRTLMQKYRDTPMSLADACVVRMAEIYDRHDVLTLDSDFTIYRKHGRVPLSLIRPDSA
jgi:predicted nucleic acid-binding protein